MSAAILIMKILNCGGLLTVSEIQSRIIKTGSMVACGQT